MLYPKQNEKREIIDLNGIWDFYFEDDEKYLVAVPGSFNEQFVGSEYKNYVGEFTYKREVIISSDNLSKLIFIRFGSVSHNAKLYVNDCYVGEHKGGFTPFEFDITKFLNIGKNIIKVVANNILDNSTLPVGNFKEIEKNGNIIKKVDENFDFFNYAGIHRPVKLWIKPKIYIEDITIYYNFLKDGVKINFIVDTVGNFEKIKLSIYDENEKLVKEIYTKDKEFFVKLEDYIRWEPLNSYLYKAKISLMEDDDVIDTYTEEFGIRDIKIFKNQFLINDKPFYFKGFGKHEDFHIIGRGLNEVLNISDLNRMKWMGANSFRTSHYPYSEEMMILADRMGFVVIDETPAVGLYKNFGISLSNNNDDENTWEYLKTYESHKKVLIEMIKRDKNHPSVVMWSIANEPASQENGAYEYFEPLFNLVKEIDRQNRPKTFVNIMMATPDKCKVTKLVDIICLNRYYGWYVDLSNLEEASKKTYDELENWHKLYKDKPIMYTEYGADTISGFHDMDFNMPFTEEYQLEYYKMNEKIFDKLSYFIGEQTWNFADFQTKYGIFRVQGNKKGVFTRERTPKMIAHHLKERWNNIPNFNYKNKDLGQKEK